MRLFETLYLLVVFTALVSLSTAGAFLVDPLLLKVLATGLLLAAVLLLLPHATREGLRWQLAPAYLSLPVLGIAAVFTAFHAPAAALSAETFGLICIFATCLFCWALPMFRLEPPTGPFQTGTTIVRMTDTSREDDSPSGHRELIVQLWYPAKASRHAFASYRRARETTRLSSYQSVLPIRSRWDAPLASTATKFPILLFNPAWNGRRTQNTFLVEELASQGFVVAAIDHTHNSEPVAFPDGRVVRGRHERAMEDVSTSTAEEVQRIGNVEVERQVLDCRCVLDQLAGWNDDPGSRWSQRLDMARAGALGHSLGGATAVECWATDARICAAMNMDGWTFGRQAATGRRAAFPSTGRTAKPLLFIYEGNYEPFPTAEKAQASGKSEVEQAVDAWDASHVRELLQHQGGYWLRLRGANHMNFTDRPISSPLRRLAGGGDIDARLAHRILREYAVHFFTQALLGVPSALLSQEPSPYAEVSAHAYPSSEWPGDSSPS